MVETVSLGPVVESPRGIYPARVDEKGRLKLPADFQRFLQESGATKVFITSFDELTVSIFISSPSLTTLPVRLFNHIAHTTTPIVASVSSVIIFLSLAAILILDRIFGLDRLLMGGKR